MNRRTLKFIASVLLISLISGCAGMSDSTRTKAEGTGAGMLLGAALGAGIGALVGGGDGAALGAAIGAGVGGIGGFAAGSYVADRKKKYANKEDRLDGEINVVATYNNDLRNYNQQTAARIKDLNQQVSELKGRYRKGAVQVGDLKNKREEITAKIHEADKLKAYYGKELADLREYRQSIAQTGDHAKVAKLGEEIDVLKKNIAMLDKGNKQMAQLVSSLTVRK